ncbi:MAG: tRNA (adenosine(37)-N6)-threonylcarbamoyltransferase complex ATPase subunit type 1 TsaE [Bacteroidales bacterium]|nr:tRNA (adenosine(37)-N6)-threonylcarbamoyltransferase complex ATPase subunit type 1 TsaE [Bacteroidales bacterium]
MHEKDDNVVIDLCDEVATTDFGRRLATTLVPGMSLWLIGDLGAGKTTLARGALRGLGFGGRVKSPTYTLVEVYPLSRFNLYHFDLYRIGDSFEWEEAGFREYFNETSVCLVEWPEKAEDALPRPDVKVHLDFSGEGRRLCLLGLTERGQGCVERLSSC